MAKYFSMDGYVCGDIQTRTTSNGHTVTQFSVNSPERRQIEGEWKTVPHFFKCQYWHKGDRDFRAEYIYDKAHVQMSGEPRYEEWETEHGKRSTVRFNVKSLFLIAKRDSAPAQPQQREEEAPLYDDDIPF